MPTAKTAWTSPWKLVGLDGLPQHPADKTRSRAAQFDEQAADGRDGSYVRFLQHRGGPSNGNWNYLAV
jgi:hypothetical protein